MVAIDFSCQKTILLMAILGEYAKVHIFAPRVHIWCHLGVPTGVCDIDMIIWMVSIDSATPKTPKTIPNMPYLRSNGALLWAPRRSYVGKMGVAATPISPSKLNMPGDALGTQWVILAYPIVKNSGPRRCKQNYVQLLE